MCRGIYFRKALFSLGMLCLCSAVCGQTLLPLKMDRYWGYVGINGDTLIRPLYDYAEAFEGAYARVRRNDTVMVLDRQGREIIIPDYGNFSILGDNLLKIKIDKKVGLRNFKGALLLPFYYEDITLMRQDSSATWLLLQQNGKEGVTELPQHVIVPIDYEQVDYREGLIVARKDRKFGVIDPEGKVILPFKYEQIEVAANYISARKKEKQALFTRGGKTLTSFRFEHCFRLNDRAVMLRSGDSAILLFPQSRNSFSSATVKWYQAVSSKFYAGYTGALYVLLDEQGKIIADKVSRYGYLGESYWFLQDSSGQAWITDSSFNRIHSVKYDLIDSCRNQVSIVMRAGRWGLFHYGLRKEFVPARYDRIVLFDELAKAYENDNIVFYNFDSEGKILEKKVFDNVMTISITRRNTYSRSSDQVRQVSLPKNEWFYDSGRWGLRRRADKEVLIPPQFALLYSGDGQGRAIVAKKCYKNVAIAGHVYLVTEAAGLVDEENAIILLKPEYAFIDYDALSRNASYARLVDMNGLFQVITDKGELLKYNMNFIDERKNGISRCYKGGMIPVAAQPQMGYYWPFQQNVIALNFSVYRNAISDKPNPKFIFLKNGHWNYIKADGTLTNESFDYAEQFVRNSAIVRMKYKYGLVDTNGAYLIPAELDSLYYLWGSDDNLLLAKRKLLRSAYINRSGDIVTGFDFEECGSFKEGLAIARLPNGRMSYINTAGEFVNQTGFNRAFEFNENRARVQIGNRYHYVNRKGELICEQPFNRAENFKDGFALCKSVKEGYILLDSNGRKLFQYKKSVMKAFSNGLAPLSDGNHFGYVDEEGKLQIPCKFADAFPFDENGLAIVKLKKRFGLINSKGEWVIPARYSEIRRASSVTYCGINGRRHEFYDQAGQALGKYRAEETFQFSDGIARIRKNGQNGFTDSNGKVVIPFCYDRAADFSMGLAIVGSGRRSFVINTKGDTLLRNNLMVKRILSPTLVLVRKAGTEYYCILNTSGNVIMDKVQDAIAAGEGMIRYKKDDNWAYMNAVGFTIVHPRFCMVYNFSESMARVSINQVAQIYNSSGTPISTSFFEGFRYMNNGIYRLEQGNRLAYFRTDGRWIVPLR